MQKDICKGKGGLLCYAAVLLCELLFNVLNFIWHGFHYPNSLLADSLHLHFLVLFACTGLHVSEGNAWKHVTAAFAVRGLCADGTETGDGGSLPFYCILCGDFVPCTVSWAIAFTERQALLFSALFYALAVVSIEAAVNTAVTSVTKPADGYTDDNAAAEKLVDSVQPNDSFSAWKR